MGRYDAFADRYPASWRSWTTTAVPVALLLWAVRDRANQEWLKYLIEVASLLIVLAGVVYPFVKYGL